MTKNSYYLITVEHDDGTRTRIEYKTLDATMKRYERIKASEQYKMLSVEYIP